MKKKKPGKKPRRAVRAARRPRARKGTGTNPVAAGFQQALELAMRGYLFDAVRSFTQVAKNDRKSEFADDALFNAGLCYMRMSLFRDAIAHFTRVIQGYPDATIASTPGAKENGRTAAKALLGRLRCSLALGDLSSAKADLASLQKYGDSYVVDDKGRKRTFHELGSEAMAVAAR